MVKLARVIAGRNCAALRCDLHQADDHHQCLQGLSCSRALLSSWHPSPSSRDVTPAGAERACISAGPHDRTARGRASPSRKRRRGTRGWSEADGLARRPPPIPCSEPRSVVADLGALHVRRSITRGPAGCFRPRVKGTQLLRPDRGRVETEQKNREVLHACYRYRAGNGDVAV
jgi:hypothetical protein